MPDGAFPLDQEREDRIGAALDRTIARLDDLTVVANPDKVLSVQARRLRTSGVLRDQIERRLLRTGRYADAMLTQIVTDVLDAASDAEIGRAIGNDDPGARITDLSAIAGRLPATVTVETVSEVLDAIAYAWTHRPNQEAIEAVAGTPRPPHPAGDGTAPDAMALAVWVAAPGWTVRVLGDAWTAASPDGGSEVRIHAPSQGFISVWTVSARAADGVRLDLAVPNAAAVSGETFDATVSHLQALGVLPPAHSPAGEQP